jgi:hypothetical protein
VIAGACGASEGLLGIAGIGVATADAGPVLDDQDDGVVERAAPGVVLAVGVAQASAVFAAFGAELAEGYRVGAGFGQAVPAVAQGMCPFAQSFLTGTVAGIAVLTDQFNVAVLVPSLARMPRKLSTTAMR